MKKFLVMLSVAGLFAAQPSFSITRHVKHLVKTAFKLCEEHHAEYGWNNEKWVGPAPRSQYGDAKTICGKAEPCVPYLNKNQVKIVCNALINRELASLSGFVDNMT
jgi:hypothetical protein